MSFVWGMVLERVIVIVMAVGDSPREIASVFCLWKSGHGELCVIGGMKCKLL